MTTIFYRIRRPSARQFRNVLAQEKCAFVYLKVNSMVADFQGFLENGRFLHTIHPTRFSYVQFLILRYVRTMC